MSNLFSSISLRKPKRTAFDMSFEHKTTCDAGKLYPVLCQEVVPGDNFKINAEMIVRLSPLVAPMYHRVNVYLHYFYVPTRIVWNPFDKFITGGEKLVNGVPPQPPVKPYFYVGDAEVGEYGPRSLADVLGVQGPASGIGNTATPVDLLPFMAYHKICDDYYRDENFGTEVMTDTVKNWQGNQSALTDILAFRNRCWEKDYFTSALPWAQKGSSVSVPVVSTDPDNVSSVYYDHANTQPWQIIRASDGSVFSPRSTSPLIVTPAGVLSSLTDEVGDLQMDPSENLVVYDEDVLASANININDLRRAEKLQEFLEKNARGGTRLTEMIYSHFGVKSPDARLQRAEFLGGGKTPVQIGEVLQTSASEDGTTPLAEMAGKGVGINNNQRCSFYVKEHGYIFAIVSVMPRATYQQGLPRMFSRFDKLDYYWPEFAHIGEQEIRQKELYFTGNRSNDDRVFGYIPRYAEYKYNPSRVSGEFTKNEMSYWHMGRKFNGSPTLSNSFLSVDPTVQTYLNNPFALIDSTADHYYFDLYFNIRAVRPMPRFGTPLF